MNGTDLPPLSPEEQADSLMNYVARQPDFNAALEDLKRQGRIEAYAWEPRHRLAITVAGQTFRYKVMS